MIKRKIFNISSFQFQCGKTIPLEISYETVGTLNEKKDNAILICHYFSAIGHACGKYQESDVASGFWDGLIGSGKTIDTDKYFVISADNLCNIQAKNPHVHTSGPASIDTTTGKPYGKTFPVTTVKDLAKTQKALLSHLGIGQVKAVMGPSLGGMIALQMAVDYPEITQRVVGVVTAPRNPVASCFEFVLNTAMQADPNYCNGDYYGKAEPTVALSVVNKNLVLNAFTPSYFEENFPANRKALWLDLDQTTPFEEKLDQMSQLQIKNFDLNCWHYTSRITMNFDLALGYENTRQALSNIQAKVLLVSNKQDMLEDWTLSQELVMQLQALGKDAAFCLLDDPFGHMAGIIKTELFAPHIKEILL